MTNPAGRKLGRRSPKNAPALKLSAVLTGAVPAHPESADYLSKATYGLYDNDTYGDCGPCSVANDRRQVTKYLTGTQVSPTQTDVFDLYRRSGNPDFDPADPGGPGDQGVDMQTMLEAVHSGGIGGAKCVAFAKVDVHNPDEIRAAVSVFGSLLLGVDLSTAQQGQQGTWDYVAGSDDWGGHAVPVFGYDPDNVELVSWGEKFEATNGFWSHQVQEAWAVVWPEHLGQAAFQQGVDLAALEKAYTDLTGRPFPGAAPAPRPAPSPAPGPAPAPVPAPVPNPAVEADRRLAQALRPWVDEHHFGYAHEVADAARKWLHTKGL